MPKKLPIHLRRERTRHGRVVYFVRIDHGPRIRIREEFGTEGFWAAYRLAIEGKAPVTRSSRPENKIGSLAWLTARYMASSAWSNGIGHATRRQRGAIFRSVNAQIGDVPFAAITKAKIAEGRERRKDKPHAANNFLKAMRALFGWASENEILLIDPTLGVVLMKADNPDGYHTWTEEEALAYEARWPTGTRERLAYDLLVYTGLRRGDVVRIGRPHVRKEILTIRTEKTGETVVIPVLPPLRASIDATQCGELTFLATLRNDKRPFDKASFGNWFKKACRAAGVPGSAHGLRKIAAVRVAEGGASEAQMNAMFGWAEGSKESSTYIKKANRAKRAASIAELLMRDEDRTQNPAPGGQVRDSGEIPEAFQALRK